MKASRLRNMGRRTASKNPGFSAKTENHALERWSKTVRNLAAGFLHALKGNTLTHRPATTARKQRDTLHEGFRGAVRWKWRTSGRATGPGREYAPSGPGFLIQNWRGPQKGPTNRTGEEGAFGNQELVFWPDRGRPPRSAAGLRAERGGALRRILAGAGALTPDSLLHPRVDEPW